MNDVQATPSLTLLCQTVDSQNKRSGYVYLIYLSELVSQNTSIGLLQGRLPMHIQEMVRDPFKDPSLWKLKNPIQFSLKNPSSEVIDGFLASDFSQDPNSVATCMEQDRRFRDYFPENVELPEKSLHMIVKIIYPIPDMTISPRDANFLLGSWKFSLNPSFTFPIVTRPTASDPSRPCAPELGLDDDDLLPGDAFLTVLEETILVRAEYLRAFSWVQGVFDAYHGSRLAVVTGDLGIGRSCWIKYAIRRCLGEGRPVIWYKNRNFYLFSGNGVEIIDPRWGRHPPYTWCFVDSADVDPLPPMVYDEDIKLFPIYVTTPEERRWAELHQLRQPMLFIMNP